MYQDAIVGGLGDGDTIGTSIDITPHDSLLGFRDHKVHQ
jgi:hypothetical protein